MSNIYFTSDLHFGHANIIKFCSRPFKDVEDMDRKLIDNWNATVSNDDTVYMLGDIFFCKADKAMNIMDQLNGHKTLVLGNHDKIIRNNDELKSKFSLIMDDLDELVIDGTKVVVCHYPLWSWKDASRGAYQLHGHIHSNAPTKIQPHKRQYDVGVDANGYRPVSWKDIKRKLDKIEITAF